MKKLYVLIVLLTQCVLPQMSQTTLFKNLDLGAGIYTQSWSTDNGQKISQVSFPIELMMPVDNQLFLQFRSASAFSSSSGSSKTLSGLTDSRISGSYLTMDDKLLITGGFNLPTGKTKLEDAESSIAGSVGLFPLVFRVPSYSQGFAFNMSSAYAMEYDDYVIGGGMGFVYKAGFQPYINDSKKYVPGFEFTVNVGGEQSIDHSLGKLRLTVDLAYTLYGSDSYGDKDVFKSGNKINLDLRSILVADKASYIVYLRERTKGRNDLGYGSLKTQDKNSNGNQIDFGGIGDFKMSDQYSLKGLLELKLYSKSEDETNGATIFALGGGATWYFSDLLYADGLIKFSTGTLSDKKSSMAITGFELGAQIKYRLF